MSYHKLWNLKSDYLKKEAVHSFETASFKFLIQTNTNNIQTNTNNATTVLAHFANTN
jgi:hypothetical protein